MTSFVFSSGHPQDRHLTIATERAGVDAAAAAERIIGRVGTRANVGRVGEGVVVGPRRGGKRTSSVFNDLSQKMCRFALGVTPQGSHRSGRAQLRHPVRPLTAALDDETRWTTKPARVTPTIRDA
jgi:hypothetical protein